MKYIDGYVIKHVEYIFNFPKNLGRKEYSYN